MYYRLKPLPSVVLPDNAQLVDLTTSAVYPDATSVPISVAGKERIIIKSLFDVSNSIAYIKLHFFDLSNQIIGESDEFVVLNTLVLDGSDYLGSMLIMNNELGAAGIKIRLMSSPTNSGKVSFFISGV